MGEEGLEPSVSKAGMGRAWGRAEKGTEALAALLGPPLIYQSHSSWLLKRSNATFACHGCALTLTMLRCPAGGVPHVREQDGAGGQPRWGRARGRAQHMGHGTA